jgi:hypothetical protein
MERQTTLNIGHPIAKPGTELIDPGTVSAAMAEYLEYRDMVEADSGALQNTTISKQLIKYYLDAGLLSTMRLLWAAEMGIKTRTSGIETFLSKGYSADPTGNHLIQATELSQPRLEGAIAPAEILAAMNAQDSVRFFAFTEISLLATDVWTLTLVLNWNGSNNAISSMIGKQSDTLSLLGKRIASVNRFHVINEDGTAVSGTSGGTNSLIGKNTVIQFIAPGDGTLIIKKDGVTFETLTISTKIKLSKLLRGYSTSLREFYGRLHFVAINGINLLDSQATAEAAFLRTLIPVIETVTIGTKQVTTSNLDVVCSPAGNVIPNITAAASVEKLVDTTFSDDSKWTKGTGWSISAGTAKSDGTQVAVSILAPNPVSPIIVDVYYKDSATVISTTGNVRIYVGNATAYDMGSVGSYVRFMKGTNGNFFYTVNAGIICEIDNPSHILIGWVGATELYNGIYTQTAGTSAQKHTAAIKAAAMWAYHTDMNTGALLGKIYNYYAVQLLLEDLVSSNYGYHVATEAENTAFAALGGAALKLASTDYWTDAGLNSSGFSSLGAGSREADGDFTTLKSETKIWCGDTAKVLTILNDGTVSIDVADPLVGAYIRLVKD